jgi:hypothetical protein
VRLAIESKGVRGDKSGGERKQRTWRAFHWSVSEMSAGDAMAERRGLAGIEAEDKLPI